MKATLAPKLPLRATLRPAQPVRPAAASKAVMMVTSESGDLPPRIIAICQQLPEAAHLSVQGTLHFSLEVRGKRFAWFVDNHHGDGRIALHCRASPGVNNALASEEPDRYFIPPYLGARGWAGVWLDVDNIDWQRVEELLVDGYLLTAPKSVSSNQEHRR